jgi:hypothetical protein
MIMTTQRICQLLISFAIITAIALVSDRSRIGASVLSVMPLSMTLGIWFIYTGSSGGASATADFTRMVLFGLIPTALFTLTCWFGFRQGWPLWAVLLVGYSVWLAAMGVYRLIDSGWIRG